MSDRGFKDRRRGVGGCGEYLPSYLVTLSAASPLAPTPLRHQLICNGRSTCGEDCVFQDDGEATIWFEPLDRHEQKGADYNNSANVETS
jgi:hypothetical protein